MFFFGNLFFDQFFFKTTNFAPPPENCAQKISEKPYFYRLKKGGQVIDPKVAKLLTLLWPKKKPSYWPYSIYIYIYICCRVKTWSKICPFLSQNLVQVFFFSFFFIFFFLQGEWDFKEKWAKKDKTKHHFLSQNLVQVCCATYLDQVLTQPWTKFWLNNFANVWVFLPVLKCTETTIFIVFSA